MATSSNKISTYNNSTSDNEIQECDHIESAAQNQPSKEGSCTRIEDFASSKSGLVLSKSNSLGNQCSCKQNITLCLYMSTFAVYGCLFRIGFDHLVGAELLNIENPDSVVFKSFFSNMHGSFLLGVIQATSLPKSSPLYIGLATGLCGCLTTYSKWNQQVSMLLVGAVDVQAQPHVVAISAIIVGLLSFVCSYQIGRDSTNMVINKNKAKKNLIRKKFSESHRCFHCCHATPIIALLLISTCAVLISVAIVFWTQNPFVLAICCSGLFAPFGALLRYVLAKVPKFNFTRFTLLNDLPTGTLLANVTGSIALALTQVVESWIPMNCTSLALLMGVQSGFIASWTTVSSFVGEVVALRARKNNCTTRASYLYAVVTVVACVLFASIINLINFELLRHKYSYDGNIVNVSFVEWTKGFQPDCDL